MDRFGEAAKGVRRYCLVFAALFFSKLEERGDVLDCDRYVVLRIHRILRVEGVRNGGVDWAKRREAAHVDLVGAKTDERACAVCPEGDENVQLVAVGAEEVDERPRRIRVAAEGVED